LAKLGFNLAGMDRIEDAVAALEKSVRLNPENAEVFFLLGDLYNDQKRNEDAITAYKKSLKINPKQKEVHYNLGTLYAEQERLDEAVAELRIAVDLDPGYFSAWKNLVSEKLDLDKEAIQAYEKLIALGKGQASDYFRLGVLYAKSNQPDPSIAAFERAVEMEPDKYRGILREELKNVHSVLDSVRYKAEFRRLLTIPWDSRIEMKD
jgi:tetratricopeptide (TPR) repeat protein